MPNERRLDVKVSASAVGVEQTAQSVRKLGQEVKKTQQQAASGLKGAKSRAEALGLAGENSVFAVARGGGAAVIAMEVGRALQGLPAAVQRYKEHLEVGGTKLEGLAQIAADTIPVAGQLAKGLHGLERLLAGTALDKFFGGSATSAVAAEERDRAKAERLAREDRQNRARAAMTAQLTAAAEPALDASRVRAFARLFGGGKIAEARARVWNQFMGESEKIGEDERLINQLDPSDPETEVRRQEIQRRRDEASRARDEQEREVIRSLTRAAAEAKKEAADTVKEAARDAAGRFGDALLDGVKGAREWIRDFVKQGKELDAHRFKAGGQLAGIGADALSAMGLDDEAARVRVTRSFAEQRRALGEMMKDRTLTEDVRDAAAELFGLMPGAERDALRRVGHRSLRGGFDSESNMTIRGAGGNPLEQQAAVKSERHQQKMVGLLDRILRAAERGTGAPAPFLNGN